MKLKCNDNRRVMVLSSGNTLHRSDGTLCHEDLTIGSTNVAKLMLDDGLYGLYAKDKYLGETDLEVIMKKEYGIEDDELDEEDYKSINDHYEFDLECEHHCCCCCYALALGVHF